MNSAFIITLAERLCWKACNFSPLRGGVGVDYSLGLRSDDPPLHPSKEGTLFDGRLLFFVACLQQRLSHWQTLATAIESNLFDTLPTWAVNLDLSNPNTSPLSEGHTPLSLIPADGQKASWGHLHLMIESAKGSVSGKDRCS